MTILHSHHVVQIGCGHMGMALLKGFLAHGELPSSFTVIDPAAAASVTTSTGVRAYDCLEEAQANGIKADIILISIKPQGFDQLAAYRTLCHDKTLIISIAAGKRIDSLSALFGTSTAIIRSMPNLPAMVSLGMTGSIANDSVTSEQRSIAEGLFACVGKHVWLDDESQMHALTAVSGSGPGYLFHMIEALAKAGESEGLPPELSLQLAKQTIAGAAHMAHVSSQTPAQLREAVTSPAGTTEAGLKILMDDAAGLETLFGKAIKAASERSRTLAA